MLTTTKPNLHKNKELSFVNADSVKRETKENKKKTKKKKGMADEDAKPLVLKPGDKVIDIIKGHKSTDIHGSGKKEELGTVVEIRLTVLADEKEKNKMGSHESSGDNRAEEEKGKGSGGEIRYNSIPGIFS